MSNTILRSAEISQDGLYRYQLLRRWDVTQPSMIFIMCNPSTADAKVDDPTIVRCMGFARRENCGGITVINRFALRSTRPEHLLHHPDPVGPQNRDFWRLTLDYHHRGPVVAAWGASTPPELEDTPLPETVGTDRTGWLTLGYTLTGHPRHPLYVKNSTPLVPFGPGPMP